MTSTTNFFNDCKTTDEAKKSFYKLALELHPDKGGDTKQFQELLRQFENFRPHTDKFEGESDNWKDLSPVYTNIIEQLIKLDGITVEIVGSYIWIGGNTWAHKAAIKAIDCGDQMQARWARKKKMWYFKPANYKPRVRKEYGMDEIRDIYGSQWISIQGTPQLGN